jgi:hypothetical protein
MDNSQLFIVFSALVSIAALGVVAYANATRKGELAELIGLVKPFFESVFAEADAALVPYGAALTPVHATFEAAVGLFDEDTDALVKRLINQPGFLAAIRAALAGGEELTDGVPLAERGATWSGGPIYTPPAPETPSV